mgnify:CR=1 FL=1
MTLTFNSIYQLALVPDKNQEFKKNNSLLGILNNCSSAIGKRLFKHRLLHPITSVPELICEYNKIDLLLEKDLYLELKKVLHEILDLERIHRRLSLGILSPNEFYGLHKSNLAIIECQKLMQSQCKEMSIPEQLYDEFQSYIQYYCSTLDIKSIYRYNLGQIERSIFVRGNYEEIDRLEDKITRLESKQEDITRQLSRLIDGKEDMIALESNDKDGYFFSLTNKRADVLKGKLEKKQKQKSEEEGWTFIHLGETHRYTLSDFTFKNGASTCKLFHKDLKKWGEEMSGFKREMNLLCVSRYSEVLKNIDDRYFSSLRKLVKFISDLDVSATHAQNAVRYRLTRPKLDPDVGPSYMSIEGVRHLIVEQIQTKVPFVSNDISLGNGHHYNILCYGYNAVGKTTLQKSICLAVIMAQSGGFAPASQMTFRPYDKLFTRISNVDNLLKGQSSYMVEMSELKYILKHADDRSLVCIDELVASTESYSGISSVVATLKILHDRNVSMFMATHLHQLANMTRVKSLTGLTIKHLEVNYDANSQKLVYDRKLKDGPGSGLYGLEVSRFLDLPKEFLDLAFEVRNELLDLQIVSHKTSSYNRDIIVDQCQICQEKAQLDVHHINFQCHADQNGNFESFHKNVDHNLVVLCKNCHVSVHNEKITIKGYVFTGDNVKLDFIDHRKVESHKTESKQPKLPSKYSARDIEIMSGFLKKLTSTNDKIVNKKFMLDRLCIEKGYKINYKTLNELLKS